MTGTFTWPKFKAELLALPGVGANKAALKAYIAWEENDKDESKAALALGMVGPGGKANLAAFIPLCGDGYVIAAEHYDKRRLNVR